MGFSEEFEKIRKDREGVVKSSVYPGLKKLVSQIYPDEAHFIYELLQNAEDACATQVEFSIEKTELIFAHNGTKQFNTADIEAITNIAHSTKTDNYVQAGKFGIGFKSVYAFTETPSIYGDSICFRIDDLLLPTEIEDLGSRTEGWTEFHFPFNSPKITAGEAKQKIKQGLLEIENTTLLFLNNIESISYSLEDGTKNRVKKVVEDNIVYSSIYEGNIIRTTSVWKRFSRTTKINGKLATVDVAFPIEIEKDNRIKFIQGKDKVSITFLAKNEKSNLKFYLNAPFGCTPARDTVNKEDTDNQCLISELALLIQDALEILKDEKLLTDDLFNILPLQEDEVPEFYFPIVEAIRESFKTKSLLPTMNGEYVTVGDGIMSSRMVIDKVFSINDIKVLYENENIQFVKNKPVTSRGYKFLKSLKIDELTPKNILLVLIEMTNDKFLNWLMKLTFKQLEEIYAYLNKGILELLQEQDKYEEYEDYIDEYYANSYYKEEHKYALLYQKVSEDINKIKKLEIVKCIDGAFYIPKETRMLTKNITIPEEYHVVNPDLIKNDDAKNFLQSIGVIEFTEKELEKYLYDQETTEFIQKINSISGEEDPLEIARMILHFFDEHKKDEVFFDDTDKYVWTNLTCGSGSNRKYIIASAKECYLDAPFINENGFTDIRDIHKKKALNDVYLELGDDELDRWIAFLKAQGIFYTFKVEMKSYGTGYITGFHHDYNIANLGPYLDKKSEALNRYLWDFLTNNWSYSYSYETKQVNKNRRWQQGDSTLLSKLKTSAWIMGKDGKWKVPSMVSESSISDKWIVNKTTGFLHAIEFGAEQRKIDEERQKKLEIEKLQQEKEQEAAVSLGFENAEAVLEAKENDAIIKELESYGVDVRNLLSTKRKERESKKYTLQEQLLNMRQNQFVAKEVEDEDEVYRVPNPERRVEKLHEEIKTEKAPEKKNAIIKKSAISKEEKLFVGTEYSGKCQICSKIIYKTDGTRHFAAINLLDTGHLEEEYLQGLSTGWNTLCMCPNCAAEYKYGAISFFDFQEKVVNTEVNKHYRDYYEFKIQMQGEDRVLKYTPRHLLSLQTALKFFEENKDKDVIEDNNDVIVENEVSVNIVEDYVCVVKSGDKCPKCGQSNTKNQKASIIDAKGERQIIDCRVCQCGKVYLTKRLKMQLPSDIKYNEVLGYASKKNKIVNVQKALKNSMNNEKCPKCSNVGLFSDKGVCWECYKDMMSSRYD